jgi:TRAP-type mannitol/chloroaromatic compound transport system permease large subunit
VLAAARRRLTPRDTAQALLDTTKLSTLVMFVLIGSTVFSLVFQGADGSVWVERLFVHLPGGATGFLLVVTLLIFVLGFFLDFFEIAFILLPLLAPIAQKLGIDLVWFGVLVGVNLQTSFMTPPFGFSLFFLRGVAPQQDHVDPRTGGTVRRIATSDIYIGVLPFVAVQVLVMVLIIVFPSLVQRTDAGVTMDARSIERALRGMAPAAPLTPAIDPIQMLLDSLRTPGR